MKFTDLLGKVDQEEAGAASESEKSQIFKEVVEEWWESRGSFIFMQNWSEEGLRTLSVDKDLDFGREEEDPLMLFVFSLLLLSWSLI